MYNETVCNIHSLGEYDKEQLLKARQIIDKIYNYHYGDSYMRSEVNRLETILRKLNQLLDSK